MECSVCCSTNYEKRVKCHYCQYESCGECVEKYLLNITSDAHCMNCRHSWDLLFLKQNLDQTFLENSFKKYRIKLLVNRFHRVLGKDFLCPCPSCHYGKIRKSTMTCSSCWIKVCEKCLCHQEEQHNCREEIVKSLNKVAELSKRCPGCRVPIEKKSGCFQMFCTQCYTAFDWKNGKILEKNIHNPHYFDHQQHHTMKNGFQQILDNMTEYSLKRIFKEFYHLMMDIETQMEKVSPLKQKHPELFCCGEDQLYQHDEERQRNLSLYVLWCDYYKRGMKILLDITKQNYTNVSYQINCFKNDLKEILIDYNEHVAECLQLRGYRLFPCNPPVLCM